MAPARGGRRRSGRDADGGPGVLDGTRRAPRRPRRWLPRRWRSRCRPARPEVRAAYQIRPAPLQDSPPIAPRREHEGTVGDAAVEVHAAVVVGGLDVVGHRPDLGVLADLRVVVRRPGVGHRPQGPTVDAGQEDPLADEPVGGGRVLTEVALLDAGAEDVRDRLVQRTRLALVGQVGRELRDGVRQLVAEHVDRLGEPVEDPAVPVAEDQLGAVPEGVVVVLLVVHGRDDRRPLVVVRRSAEVGEERQRLGDPGGRLVDGHVARPRAPRPCGPAARAASSRCRRRGSPTRLPSPPRARPTRARTLASMTIVCRPRAAASVSGAPASVSSRYWGMK